MVHFSVLDYSLEDEGVKEHWDMPICADHWHFPQFHRTLIPYMIFSNCDEVRIYLNGKRIYLPKPAGCPNRIITGFLPWQPGTVKAVGICNGIEMCTHTTVTPGAPVKLEFERVPGHVRAEKGYELLLTAGARDEQGKPYFRESSRVRFRVDGPAEIIAVDNGNLMGNEPYGDTSIHMYHGKVSVLIRLSGEAGRISVSADAEGLYTGTAIVCAE